MFQFEHVVVDFRMASQVRTMFVFEVLLFVRGKKNCKITEYENTFGDKRDVSR